MRILIATPCYGGMLTSNYTASLIDTCLRLRDDGYNFGYSFLPSESLISRGRNKLAYSAINHNFDKLFFIDADMIWDYSMVKRLLTSDKLLIGGTYPMKTFPITLNLNPLEKDRDVFGKDRQLDNYMELAKRANDKGELEVLHIPTGFMMIDRAVLVSLASKVPTYTSYNPDIKETASFFDLFPCGSRNGEFESEDWAFCRLAKEAGFPVYLNVHCVTGHTGSWNFTMGQHVITGQKPLIK